MTRAVRCGGDDDWDEDEPCGGEPDKPRKVVRWVKVEYDLEESTYDLCPGCADCAPKDEPE